MMMRATRLPQYRGGARPGLCSGPCRFAEFCSTGGFTLAELVVTMVVVGILATVLAPKFFNDTGFEARGLRDETAASLRYAQKSAIASRRQVCLKFSANGLTATTSNTFSGACLDSNPLPGPSGGALQITGHGGATYASHPGNSLTFDSQGRPPERKTISVQGLPSSLDLVVEAETGYVH